MVLALKLRMLYVESLWTIGSAYTCGRDLHLVVDDPAGRYYGPYSLRGSRLMRIASSLDLFPKVTGIDHPEKRSCVLYVLLRKGIKRLKCWCKASRDRSVVANDQEIEVLLQRIKRPKSCCK